MQNCRYFLQINPLDAWFYASFCIIFLLIIVIIILSARLCRRRLVFFNRSFYYSLIKHNQWQMHAGRVDDYYPISLEVVKVWWMWV